MKTVLFPMFIESSKGGMQQVVYDLLKNLPSLGYECIYIGYANSEVETYYRENGIKTIGLSKPRTLIQLIIFTLKFYKLIWKYKDALIVTNDIYSHILLSLYIGKKHEIFVSHGGDYKSKGLEYAAKSGNSAKIAKCFSFKRVRAFVAVSDTQKEALVNNAHIEKNKIFIIYNGYKCGGNYNKNKKLSEKINLAIVGYIKRLKNQHVLIETLYQLRMAGFDCMLNLYGSISDNEYYEELVALIKEKELLDYVVFHGYVSNKDEIYLNNDLILSCSHHEGFGLSLVEAMAYRIPTIAYEKAAGPSIIIDNGETGILVPDNTSEAYYKAIVLLLTDDKLYSQIQNNAFLKYEKEFSLQVMINKYNQLLRSIKC